MYLDWATAFHAPRSNGLNFFVSTHISMIGERKITSIFDYTVLKIEISIKHKQDKIPDIFFQ